MEHAHSRPNPAATTVLCKVTTDWPYKILFVKRSLAAQFLPGAHVFPGGSIDSDDLNFARFLASDHQNLIRLQNYFATDIDIIAHFLAGAIRETLEEVGLSILHVRKEPHPTRAHQLKELFSHPDSKAYPPSLDNIWALSWWVTPKGEARRYNTWFFLATIDEASLKDQIHNETLETSLSIWLYPHEALLLYDEKKIFLAPPTRSIVERMASSTSFDDFLCHIDQPLWPIKPFFIDDETGKKWLILPGDKEHHEQRASSLPLKTRYSFP